MKMLICFSFSFIGSGRWNVLGNFMVTFSRKDPNLTNLVSLIDKKVKQLASV